VLNHFSGEMAVAGAGKPESFRITPVLLDGAPGVGKTAFAMAFANMLGLPFVKMSAGGMQHAAVLAGTAQHWGNSQPGGVFNLLSKSDSAAAVLLIDEVDKLSNWTGYSLLPALLELLEPESSSKYVDESLRLTFDASRLIVLMTSNSTQHMDLALVSRCQVFTIDLPDVDQKMLVAREAHDKTNKSMPARNRLDLDVDALRRLAENDIDIRTLLMSVRNGWARAIENGSKIVVPEMPRKIEKKNQIGFMKGS
jgi:ATP-dependent Lon protease